MNDPREGTSVAASDVQRFRDALSRLPRGQGRFESVMRVVIRGWCRVLGWHISVTCKTQLPTIGGAPGSGCVVVAAPHRAWPDPFLLLAAWPADAARLVWLADGRTVTRSRWRRWLLPRLGVIPIERRLGGPRRYADLAAEVLTAGHALAVFPEVGPPSPPDRSRRISPGFAYLALHTGAPVVPVVIAGTHRIVRRSSFSVDILTAIDVGAPIEDPFTPAARTRAHELARQVADVVAGTLPERTSQADARAPRPERWRWLATLFS